jgi:hypothetical protein
MGWVGRQKFARLLRVEGNSAKLENVIGEHGQEENRAGEEHED